MEYEGAARCNVSRIVRTAIRRQYGLTAEKGLFERVGEARFPTANVFVPPNPLADIRSAGL